VTHITQKHGIDRATLERHLAVAGQSVTSVLEFGAKRSSVPRTGAARAVSVDERGQARRLQQDDADDADDAAEPRVAVPEQGMHFGETVAMLREAKRMVARRERNAPVTHLEQNQGEVASVAPSLLARTQQSAEHATSLLRRGRELASKLSASPPPPSSETRRALQQQADRAAIVHQLVTKAQEAAAAARKPSAPSASRQQVHLEMPGWATGVDWKAVVSWVHSAASVIKTREAHAASERRRLGEDPHGAYAEEHMVQGDGMLSKLLNWRAPRTTLGNMLRGSADTTVRRASEHDDAELADLLLRHYDEEDPLAGLRTRLEHGNRHLHPTRRLVDSWLGAAAQVPISSARVVTRFATYPKATDGLVNDAARTILFDTLLCYLYSPSVNSNDDEEWAGAPIKVFRTRRLCFPAIPYLPQHFADSRSTMGLSQGFDFNELKYENVCDHKAVQAIADVLGSPYSIIQYGVWGAAYRFGEAMDAVRNFEAASGQNLTDTQTATYITCGVAQMGGIFYTAIVVAALLLSLTCIPPACVCGAIIFKGMRGCANRVRLGPKSSAPGDKAAAKEATDEAGAVRATAGYRLDRVFVPSKAYTKRGALQSERAKLLHQPGEA